MNYQNNENLRDKLASEYALGTLKGAARRRMESWLKNDAALRRSVAEWQDRLYPFAEIAPAVSPPAYVWRTIEKRLGRQSGQLRQGWMDNLYFWRGLGMASTAVATLLMVVLLVRQPVVIPAMPTYIAMLTDEKARPAIVVKGDTHRKELTVKTLIPQNIGHDKSLELWALPKEGKPQSLGLVQASGEVALKLPPNVNPEQVPALAISIEPKGGSPNPNAPSGPVVFKGAWVQV